MTESKPRRGHRISEIDDVDLRLAGRELDAGRELLMNAYALTDRRARAEAIRAAVAKLALASRAIDVVVDRRNTTKGAL